MLLTVSDEECLRDDAYAVAAKARAQGVRVELLSRSELPHAWPVLNALISESRTDLRRIADFIGGLAVWRADDPPPPPAHHSAAEGRYIGGLADGRAPPCSIVNASGRRSGTQWEGRHKASLIDAEHYLLTCYRYIALNPPRAGSVRKPADWLRSSFQANAYGSDDQPTKPHDVDLALGLLESFTPTLVQVICWR